MWALSDDLQMDILAGHVYDAFTLCCVMHGIAAYPLLRFRFIGILLNLNLNTVIPEDF